MYLSEEWFAAASAALDAADLPVAERPPVTFGYVIDDLPGTHPAIGTVQYVIEVTPASGRAAIRTGSADADVRFTMSYATALAVASAERGGSRAFLDGDIRVGGEVAILIERAGELEAVAALLPTPGASDA